MTTTAITIDTATAALVFGAISAFFGISQIIAPGMNVKMNQRPDDVPAMETTTGMYRFFMGPSFLFFGAVNIGIWEQLEYSTTTIGPDGGAFIGFAVWGAMLVLGKFGIIPGFDVFPFKTVQFWVYQVIVWAAAGIFGAKTFMYTNEDNDFLTSMLPYWIFGIFFLVQAVGMLAVPETFWGQFIDWSAVDDEAKSVICDYSRLAMWGPAATIGGFWLSLAVKAEFPATKSFGTLFPMAVISFLLFNNMAYQMFGPPGLGEKHAMLTRSQIFYVVLFEAQAVVYLLASNI